MAGMNAWSGPVTVLEAIESAAGVVERGFTFVDEGGHEVFLPFRDLVGEVRRSAAGLQALGLSRGNRVAVIVPDHHPFIVAFLAAIVAGLVPVPIYPPISLARLENWVDATDGILRAAGAAAIITVDEVAPVLWSLAARRGARILTCKQLAAHPGASPTPVHVDLDDLAFLQFTSGSTAAPRGVMVSHRNIAENCIGIISEFMQSASEDVGVSWLPLYHDMGLIGFTLAPLFSARSVVFLATLGFLKRPALWFELIHRHRATVTFAPNFAYALAVRRVTPQDLAGWDLSCLRVAGCGGEPIMADTLRAFSAKFAAAGFREEAFCPCYGMAEATLMVTYTRIDEMWRTDRVDADWLHTTGKAVPAQADSPQAEFVGCGRSLAGFRVRIIDEFGRPLPERTVGEIEFCGPSLTLGYFNDPEASAQSYRENGLRTGDLGYLADGNLFVTGRKKDLIIVRGRNYAPQAIEWLVGSEPGVRAGRVVAFARPGRQGTDEVVVVCESAATDVAALRRAIIARVSEQLGLTIAEVVILPAGLLPKTSSGKLQRAKTRALFLDGTLARMAAAKPPTRWSRQLNFTRVRLGAAAGWLEYRVWRTLNLSSTARSGYARTARTNGNAPGDFSAGQRTAAWAYRPRHVDCGDGH